MDKKFIILLFVFLTVGFAVGRSLNVNITRCTNRGNFKYINGLLSCSKVNAVNKAGYVVFSNNLQHYIEDEVEKKRIGRMSVFFRDLNEGPTVSINGEERFIPASLLKVPVAIAYYAADEELKDGGNNGSIFDKHLAFNGELDTYKNISQIYKPKETLLPNISYSVHDLIFRMLAYSDNGSYEGLLGYLKKLFPGKDYLLGVFNDLGIIDPKNGLEETLSAKSLASNFRLLYDASYLSKEHSEEMLNMLARSEFKKGINAGVPEDVEVAHKFGERQLGARGDWEFHDCGIVYYPGNPYSICIMASGHDPDLILKAISNVSRMFYEEFDSRKI